MTESVDFWSGQVVLDRIDVDGVSTRVLRAGPAGPGSAPPVLLLHGRGGHLETWRHTVAALAVDRRVYAMDLLGHGATADAGSRYDIGELTGHVAATLRTLDLPVVDIVGQSLGGWVAAQLAREGPEVVRRLVLIEAAGLLSESERLADPRIRAAYERGGKAYVSPTPEAVRERLTGLVADPTVIDEELVRIRTQWYGPEQARSVHVAVRAADNGPWLLDAAALSEIAAPTLLLRGEHGHTPAEVMQAAADALPDGRLVTIPEAKQWPQYEQPERVNALVLEHLDKEIS